MSRSGIMLCYPFEERRLLKWAPPYLVQRKLDGERCRAIVMFGEARMYSSQENEFPFLQHIKDALLKLELPPVELDGELYVHGVPFSDIHSLCSRRVTKAPEEAMVEYHIFDYIIPDEVMYSRAARLDRLQQHIRFMGQEEVLKVVPCTQAHNMDDIMRLFDDYVDSGYEGFIVRNKDAKYIRKRSVNIMKFKPHQEDVYEVIGFQEEVSQYGMPKGTLGAFICRGDDGTPFNVGSGPVLTQEARRNLWVNKESLLGLYMMVKFQTLTTAKGVPRFPVALKLMDLKAAMEEK